MATDNFWLNPYDEEEKERLRQHQLRMGVTPAPPYGPFGGGIGRGAYQGTLGVGTPTILPGEETIRIRPTDPTSAGMAPLRELAGPTVNKFTPLGSDYTPQQLHTPVEKLQQQNIPQNVIPITPTDTTLAGMATVPFTGMESYFGDGTKVASGPTEKPMAQELPPMGIYEDLLSKKTLYDMGPGHPTVIKELVKTLEDQRNAVVNPGPTPEEIEVIIEKAISAPSGNLERIAADRAVAQAAQTGPSAADIQRDKQAAVDARNAEKARQTAINAQMAQEAAARQRQQQQAVAAEQARQAQAALAAQEATRKSLENQMRNWQGRDEQDESAMAQIQAALDHIADLQGTGVTSGSTGDRSGKVREAMRSVGYGGPEWT